MLRFPCFFNHKFQLSTGSLNFINHIDRCQYDCHNSTEVFANNSISIAKLAIYLLNLVVFSPFVGKHNADKEQALIRQHRVI